MVRFALSLVSTIAVIAALASACNGDAMHVADDASVPEAGVDGLDTWQPDAVTPSDRDDPDPPRSEDVPDGWVLDRTYDNSCNFWVPVTREQLPPPIKWEPCPATAVPTGSACELMAIDWVPGSSTSPVGVDSAWLRPDGVLVLVVARSVNKPTTAYRLLAESDGAVLAAHFMADANRCYTGFGRIANGHYAMPVFTGAGSSSARGAILGRLDSVAPTAAIHLPATNQHSIYATPFGAIVATTAELRIHDWETGAAKDLLWSAAQDDDLQADEPASAANASFWRASRRHRNKINVYTPEGGTGSFLDPGPVSSPGYGSLGTDGKDLVWTVGEGHTEDPYSFDSLSIMTAPFTADPGKLVARRLRSEEGGILDGRSFFVGCGHAVGRYAGYLRVVRIGDGQSWKLEGSNPEFRWVYQMGMTCTHVYGVVTLGSTTRLARVRIDSLGPGIPPD